MIKIITFIAIAILPFSYFKLFANFSYSDLLFSIAFIIFSLNLVINRIFIKKIIKENIFFIPIAIFSFGFFLSWSNSLNHLDSFYSYLQILFIFMILYPVFFSINFNHKYLIPVMYALAISSSLIMILLISYFLMGYDAFNDFLFIQKGWGNRFSYGNLEPNITARIMAQCVPIFLIVNEYLKKKIIIYVNYLFIGLLIISIIATASRSGLIILIIGLFFYFLFKVRLNSNYKMNSLILPLSIFFLILYYININYSDVLIRPFERYYTIFDSSSSYSSTERLVVFEKAVELIDKKPIIGYGMGNSDNLTGVVLHNPILLSWLENGLFGFIGLLIIYLMLIFYIYKDYMTRFSNNNLLMSLALITLMMIIGDMFMAASYKRVLWVPCLIYLSYSNQILKKA